MMLAHVDAHNLAADALLQVVRQASERYAADGDEERFDGVASWAAWKGDIAAVAFRRLIGERAPGIEWLAWPIHHLRGVSDELRVELLALLAEAAPEADWLQDALADIPREARATVYARLGKRGP